MAETVWGLGPWGLMPWGEPLLVRPLDISYRTVIYGRTIPARAAVLVDHISKMGSP